MGKSKEKVEKKAKAEKPTRNLNEQVRFTNKVVKDGLRNAASHHIDSFNYALTTCLPRICKYMPSVEVSKNTLTRQEEKTQLPFKKFSIWFESFELKRPTRPAAADTQLNLGATGSKRTEDSTLLPSECRLRGMNYTAQLMATVVRKIDDETEDRIQIPIGDIPVMVRSNFCHLAGMDEEQLARAREDMHEFGGYFIINGNEKIVRMLIVAKRNYPVCFSRPNFCNRGRFFTAHAV